MVDLSGVKTIKPQWLKPDSGYKVLVQFGRETRVAELSDVPTARELALNPSARALIELTELPYKLSRPFAAPPGVPEDRARALQAAFLATHKDPQFRADADKANIDISPVGPEAVIERHPPDREGAAGAVRVSQEAVRREQGLDLALRHSGPREVRSRSDLRSTSASRHGSGSLGA